MGNQQKQAPKAKPLNPMELQTYIMVTQVKLNQGRNKKINLIKKKQEEIIKHLNENNLDIAKAKMESLMREEDYITVYDILGPLCEILKEKVTYIMTSKECPEDLRASLDTLIFSSTRLEFEELHMIREFMKQKFTNIYVDKANSNIDKLVNVNVVDKLTVKPYPQAELVCRLKAICERENIQFSFPQLSNPLIFDAGLNNGNKNVVIPTIPNFNNLDGQQGAYNKGNNYAGYPYPMNMNMNMSSNNNSNMMPGYGMQMPFTGNNFPPQGNFTYPQVQFAGMQPGSNSMQQHPQQIMPNFSVFEIPNNPNNQVIPSMQNPSNAFDANGNSSFNLLPNNFSNNNNISQNPNINANNNVNLPQQPGINFPSQYANNLVIPPMNSNSTSESGFNSMPGGNNTFPAGKSDSVPMMSCGFPPTMNNADLSNTFPQGKIERNFNNNNGFPTMGAMAGAQSSASPSFPNINSPNFTNVDNLEFPSSDNKKKN